MSSRRNFLKSAAMLSLGASMMPEVAFAASKKKAPKAKGGKSIGLQLYSVGPEVSGANTAEGLKRLREMGYTYVELAGFLGHSASELKKMTDDAGIKIMSTHLNPNTNGEKYSQANKQQIVDFWKKQIDEHASFTSSAIHGCNNIHIFINLVAKHKLGKSFAKHVEAILFFLRTIVERSIIGFAPLDKAVDDGTRRYRFEINVANNPFTASIMLDLNVLDAVMANINANSLTLSANSSN